MKKSQATSVLDNVQAVFGLLGVIPYLLAIYIFIHSGARLTPQVSLVSAAVLSFHLMGYYILRRIAAHMHTLASQADKAAKQKEAVNVDASVPAEIIQVAERINDLLSELGQSDKQYREVTTRLMLYAKEIEDYQSKLKHEALVRERLSRYVGGNVVEHLLRSGEDMPLQNRKLVATILFADIRSFTRISEGMAPEEVIAMLNEYFNAMVDIIFKYNGVLDKFIGDELMAVFGLMEEEDAGCLNAVRCAMEMRATARELAQQRRKAGLPVFEVGIGINTGEVVVGNLGSKNRMDYTVIGDTVNVASRLEGIAKGQHIVVGEETYRHCGGHISMQPRKEVRVKNRAEPVKCYEVAD